MDLLHSELSRPIETIVSYSLPVFKVQIKRKTVKTAARMTRKILILLNLIPFIFVFILSPFKKIANKFYYTKLIKSSWNKPKIRKKTKIRKKV